MAAATVNIRAQDAFTLPPGYFCAPTALAYVMRVHPDETVSLLQSVMSPSDYTAGEVRGVNDEDMLKVLTKAKVSVMPAMPKFEGKLVSLKRWLKLVPRDTHPYLVSVRQHVLVVHEDRYFDPMACDGKPLSECPYRYTYPQKN